MKNPFTALFRVRDKPQDSVSAAPTFYFGTSGSGKPVNASTAIQLSTVYACVRVISETVASLPLGVYEAKEDGNRKATEHPFKWNPNTPEKFNAGLGDFQHIGLVTSVNPLRIVHASSAAGCVTTDTKLGKWAYWGWLKDVSKADNLQHTPSEPTEGDDEPIDPLVLVFGGEFKRMNPADEENFEDATERTLLE